LKSWIGFFASAFALAVVTFYLLRLRKKLFNTDIPQTYSGSRMFMFIIGIFTAHGTNPKSIQILKKIKLFN